VTDLTLTAAQQTEIYNALHNPAAYFLGAGHVFEQYFVNGGPGQTRIQQAVAQQFATVNAAIDLLIAAVTDSPTKADLAAAVTDIKACINQASSDAATKFAEVNAAIDLLVAAESSETP
jgi:hypothetical protein